MPKPDPKSALFPGSTAPEGDQPPLVNQSNPDDDIPFGQQASVPPVIVEADLMGGDGKITIDPTSETAMSDIAKSLQTQVSDLKAERDALLTERTDLDEERANLIRQSNDAKDALLKRTSERDIAVSKAHEYEKKFVDERDKLSESQRDNSKLRRETEEMQGVILGTKKNAPQSVMPVEDSFSKQVYLALLTGFASRGDLSRRSPGQTNGGVADDAAVLAVTKHIAGVTAFAVEAAKAARL